MMVIRVNILCENELITLINAICLFRVNNVQEQSLSGGTSNAALLAGVAELTAETCRTRLYRAHQRGQVMFCVIYLTNNFTDSGSVDSLMRGSVINIDTTNLLKLNCRIPLASTILS